jgi:iron uptake system component EfeO
VSCEAVDIRFLDAGACDPRAGVSPFRPSARIETVTRFVIATTSFVLAVGIGVSARADGAATAAVGVDVTESACEPNELSVPAGRVTFSIRNSTSRALEWEILDGVMVVDERENITPGVVQNLTTKLAPGDYRITCGFASNPKGSLHVAAIDGAEAKVALVDLIGPLAEYRVYASYEIDGLVDDTRRVAEALRSGDVKTARESFSAAHAHYARLAPIALFFPDLDGDADPQAEDHDKNLADDPACMGFRQLAWELFASPGPHDFGAVANKLVADAVAMQARFEDLPLTPAPTFAGATEAIGGIALARTGGESDLYTATELSDLRANIEGVRKIVDLFQSLIARADDRLGGALAEDFATVAAILAKYQNTDGALEPVVSLSSDDRTRLQTVLKKLAGELLLVPAALGID